MGQEGAAREPEQAFKEHARRRSLPRDFSWRIRLKRYLENVLDFFFIFLWGWAVMRASGGWGLGVALTVYFMLFAFTQLSSLPAASHHSLTFVFTAALFCVLVSAGA